MVLPNIVITNLVGDNTIENNVFGSAVQNVTFANPSKVIAKTARIESSYFFGSYDMCNFDGCNIYRSLFNFMSSRTNFTYASISNTTIKGRIEISDFTNAQIGSSDFDVEADGFIMRNVEFSSVRMNAEINNTDFSGTISDDVEYLDGIALYNNDFRNCNLSSCSFRATEVDNCNFMGAYLGNVTFYRNMQ